MPADQSTKTDRSPVPPNETLDGIRDAMRKLDTARKELLEERSDQATTGERGAAAARRRRVRSRTR